MKLLEDRGAGPRGNSLLPMINVVFLLLIFLMLMGEISNPYVLVAEPAETSLSKESGPPSLMVVIDQNNTIGFEQVIGEGQVLTAIGKALESKTEPYGVTLRVDRSADFFKVLLFSERLHDLGVTSVSVQVRAK